MSGCTVFLKYTVSLLQKADTVLSACGILICGISCLHEAAATTHTERNRSDVEIFNGVSMLKKIYLLKSKTTFRIQINKSKQQLCLFFNLKPILNTVPLHKIKLNVIHASFS